MVVVRDADGVVMTVIVVVVFIVVIVIIRTLVLEDDYCAQEIVKSLDIPHQVDVQLQILVSVDGIEGLNCIMTMR